MNTPAHENSLIFALKPKYAELIMSGEKTIELRRQLPQFPEALLPKTMWLYASSPQKALVGRCLITEMETMTILPIWGACHLTQDKEDEVLKAACVTEAEFQAYFERAAYAALLYLRTPRRLPEPIPLATLRERVAGFRPPQSYAYYEQRVIEQLTIGGLREA